MKSSRRKILALAIAVVLLCITGIFGWRANRQAQLDRALLSEVKHQETDRVISLLAAGADANTKDVPSSSRLIWRRLWDRLRGRNVSAKPAQSALLVAVQGLPGTGPATENIPLTKALLDRGADVNARDEQGTTALMSAAMYGYPATVQLLLERGATINLADDESYVLVGGSFGTAKAPLGRRTALQYASEFGNVQIMRMLLKQGADTNVRNGYGQSLVMEAVASGTTTQLRLLLTSGADVNATDKDGDTALMYAVNSGYLDTISLLVQHGADVNARNKKGETALMYTMEPLDNQKALQLLLKLGADAQVISKTGKTALKLAQKQHDSVSISLLKQAGAKQ